MDNLRPGEFKEIDPVYLSVRRDTLVHLGIVNPSDPYDFSLILENVSAFINDVRATFSREFLETELCPITVDNNCNGTISKVPAFVKVNKLKVVAANRFAPTLYAKNHGLLDIEQDFIGLDQFVIINTDTANLGSGYDLNFELLNKSDPPNPVFDGKGYDFIMYQPNPGDSNNGQYFFRLSAKVQIIEDNIH